MSVLRRIGAVAAAAVLGATLCAPAANADWTFYRTDPHVIACWQKVNAYGGVYQVSNGLLNGTGGYHTAQVQTYRPGAGVIADQVYTSAPGEWKLGALAHVALVPNDSFLYYLDGGQAVNIPANGIPYYMNHCKVKESPSAKVRLAISYGLAQLDSVYVGCYGGNYRHGVVPTSDKYHDGRKCGQSRVYYQPAGVKGFDCSGLVMEMYKAAGVPFTWDGSDLIRGGVPQVPKSQIQVGDLLAKSGHVAFYLGDGDGDGVASVLEATPKTYNADGTWTGVVISDATGYLNDGAYTAHRVPGAGI
ncbi:hypothetical protein F4553_007662 [Allocatelliglobosispora scoriae]|uniref:NlpC/P60 domain-containing protein n=1 Tax=Allocatelliglobosispora scoriae TaxID=643052 RepID=A0A841C387_9ACTN|nr:NlpC/P60 family protein [Allocatelliglobosispora scoriae]MBB5874228.1 hypothetical protein [Allocatelliglobosispora scoriae]